MIIYPISKYPRNVVFAQRLKDLEQTAVQYFNVSGDEIKEKFANAVETSYYTAEIGLEELEIFDRKAKAVFNNNIDYFKGLYNARVNMISEIATGTYETETHTGTEATEYGHKLTDKTIEPEKTGETVYADVSETERTFETEHAYSGTDTRRPNLTRKVVKAGDAGYFVDIVNAGDEDIFAAFTEKFKKLFMGVL